MIVSCQQPNYFPWLGFFEQIAQSERFLFLDTVQWIKQGRQHRTRIPHPTDPQKKSWLTIPVHSHAHREKQFKDIQVDTFQNWTLDHANILKDRYQHAPYYSSQLEPLLNSFWPKVKKEKFLLDICLESLYLFWEPLELKAELFWSSDFEDHGTKTERLIYLCQKMEATQYYSALGSSRYLDLSLFRAANILVKWQHFRAHQPNDLLRPLDYSVLDWVAHQPLDLIKKALEPVPSLRTMGSETSL